MLPAVLAAVAVASLIAGLAVVATAHATERPTFLSGHRVGIALIALGCVLGIALEVVRWSP